VFEGEDVKFSTILELSKNKILQLPPDIAKFKALIILDLSHNKLNELPDELCSLRTLKKLILNNNKFTEFPPQINRIESLEQLLISHNRIEKITENVCIPNIRVIYASHNDLSCISNSFGNMKHLQEIHMKNNILESFDFVESLTNLHVLDLSHNLLIRSADLSHHCHLLELNLSYNRLTMIPFVRGVCMFNISRNMIASLVLASGKETTLKIKKERVLDLDSSQDGEALGVAQQSVNESRLSVMGNTLTAFNISDNLLKNIDDIYLLHNLQELNAAHNDIMLLNRKLAKLSKLRVLNLAQNRIQKLPKNLDKLVALRALYLQDNDIDTLPSCLVQCKIWPAQGGHCNLTGNPLSLIPAYYRPVDKLYRFLKDISHDSQQSFIRNRVMVVGDSGVGKTTLVRKLTNTFRLVKDGIFKSIDSTVGIERTEIQLQKVIDSKERLISLDFWDFGGEGQYRTTHAFFSSSSAQYVVAFNVLYPCLLFFIFHSLRACLTVSSAALISLELAFLK
jgi:Leucine-rich repeat (LRR) protein